MPKGKETGQTCALCGQPVFSGQLTSGAARSDAPPLASDGSRVSDEQYYEGHYACVLEALGPAEVLKATHDGRLPMIDPAILEDGCLPDDWVDHRWVDVGKIQASGQPDGVGAAG